MGEGSINVHLSTVNVDFIPYLPPYKSNNASDDDGEGRWRNKEYSPAAGIATPSHGKIIFFK